MITPFSLVVLSSVEIVSGGALNVGSGQYPTTVSVADNKLTDILYFDIFLSVIPHLAITYHRPTES